MERTLCLVKPEAVPHIQAIRAKFERAGFEITKQQGIQMSDVRAEEFLKNGSADINPARLNSMVRHISSAPVVAFVLTRVGAVNVLKQMLGPDAPKAAKLLNPNLLRAQYGRDGLRNAFYASETVKAAGLDVGFLFPDLGVHGVPNEEIVSIVPLARYMHFLVQHFSSSIFQCLKTFI